MKHDKYTEGKLAQISDRSTITLNWFAVFHTGESPGLLTSSAIRLIVRRMWEICMRTQGFLGYPEFLPTITATSSPPLFRVIGKKGGGKAWPAALQHLRRPWE